MATSVPTRGRRVGIPTLKEIKKDPGVWRSRLAASAKWRSKYEDVWRNCWDAYLTGTTRFTDNGLWSMPGSQETLEDGFVIINHHKPSVNQVLTQSLLHSPKVKAHAWEPHKVESARMVELYSNQMIRQFKMVDKVNMAAVDMEIIGHGWNKIWWEHETDEVNRTEQVYIEEADRLTREVKAFVDAHPEASGDMPAFDDVNEGALETARRRGREEAEVVKSHPISWYIDPFDIFVSPSSKSMDDLQWICHRQVRNVTEVRKDETYNPAARKLVTPSSRAFETELMTANRSIDDWERTEYNDQQRQVAVYEYWSLEDGLFGVFCEGINEWLVKPGPFPAPRHPFIMFESDPVPKRFYPAGGIGDRIGIGEAINSGATTMLLHRNNSISKILMRNEHLTEDVKSAITSPIPQGIVALERTGQSNLDDFAKILQPAPMSPDWYNMDSYFERAYSNVGGGKSLQDEKVPIEKTATEVDLQHQNMLTRSQRTTVGLQKAVSEMVRTMIAYAKINQDKEIALISPVEDGVVKDQGVTIFSRERLLHELEYELDVQIGATPVKDDAATRQQAIQLAQILWPYVQAGYANAYTIVEMLARDLGAVDPASFIAEGGGQMPMGPPGMGQMPGGPPPPGGPGMAAPGPGTPVPGTPPTREAVMPPGLFDGPG